MRDMQGTPHPGDDVFVTEYSKQPVWYLSHPLAPDDKYTFQQNMDHILHMTRLFWEEGYHVIAPCHTCCLVLDDKNAEHRARGLGSDLYVAASLGRIILSGHRISKGMQMEHDAVRDSIRTPAIWKNWYMNLVGQEDDAIREFLRERFKLLNGR